MRHAYRVWKRYRSMLKKLRHVFKRHKVHVIPDPVDVAQSQQDCADEGAFVCFDFISASTYVSIIIHFKTV